MKQIRSILALAFSVLLITKKKESRREQ